MSELEAVLKELRTLRRKCFCFHLNVDSAVLESIMLPK